jgi:hypothetical protein
MTPRRPLVISKSRFRSALTNGKDVLAEIDGRSSQARRFRDLYALYASDLGGDDAGLSEGQLALVRRTAALTLELERLETEFARNGGATRFQLETYQRATNSLRRLVETLGIARGRIARNVMPTLDEYLQRKTTTIEHEAAE